MGLLFFRKFRIPSGQTQERWSLKQSILGRHARARIPPANGKEHVIQAAVRQSCWTQCLGWRIAAVQPVLSDQSRSRPDFSSGAEHSVKVKQTPGQRCR